MRARSALPAVALFATFAAAACGGAPKEKESHGSMPQPQAPTCPGVGPNGFNPEKIVFFGDLHSHTSYSLDALSAGARSDPRNAYLFAKGKATVPLESPTTGGELTPRQQPRPLDFLAVTDHSESLAETHGCNVDPKSPYYDDADCAKVRSRDPAVQEALYPHRHGLTDHLCGSEGDAPACVAQTRSAWADIRAAAKDANEPCHFTSFVGYEWTNYQEAPDPTTGKSADETNHRNVIFGSDDVPPAPLDSNDYPDPPSLWRGLDAACQAARGCEVVTIPHNTNKSAGVSLVVWDASPEGVDRQHRYQVAAEIYQHKGASECAFDPAGHGDPDCDFEQLGPDIPSGSFVRSGLEAGIGFAADVPGPNPLELGFVGGSDDHNGAPGDVDDANWSGHVGLEDDTPLARLQWHPEYSPGGITGVWAEQNTRASLFAAIRRRETFATSGPRIQVRFYRADAADACTDPAFPRRIVRELHATPMGGTFESTDLTGASSGWFAVAAWPDAQPQALANGTTGVAGLDTVQIIKASVHRAADGTTTVVEEAPFVVSGVPSTGGCATWKDPAFDPGERAFYYVRVLQVPTWRWSHYDCAALRASHPDDWADQAPSCAPGGGLDVTIRERAWTSPIWYVP